MTEHKLGQETREGQHVEGIPVSFYSKNGTMVTVNITKTSSLDSNDGNVGKTVQKFISHAEVDSNFRIFGPGEKQDDSNRMGWVTDVRALPDGSYMVYTKSGEYLIASGALQNQESGEHVEQKRGWFMKKLRGLVGRTSESE